MADYPSPGAIAALRGNLNQVLNDLPEHPNGDLIMQMLNSFVNIAGEDLERLDFKILHGALTDMEQAFLALHPYRHTRKIAIFGSARLAPTTPEYQMAREFAKRIAEQGYMVITGAGPGIMQAGNEGAGPEQSIGLNIKLPFEQGSNPFIEGDPKLVSFKYFFTRKLFFLKESDAIALFPGGFGTQDEAFECITLGQTGKTVPVPMVLIDKPGGSYWRDWATYIENQLLKNGLISPGDTGLFTVTDRLDVAVNAISSFYQVYHSNRYVGEQLVIRLRSALPDIAIAELNERFNDILVKGQIQSSKALPEEAGNETFDLPRLVLHFNQRDLGRLFELIRAINHLGAPIGHPEWK
ncbi:MAG: hypothetical protein RLZZ511_3194 [Cyanobacteriota bacterium]|jgi:uncharacterized protein (TIGR00730 family)